MNSANVSFVEGLYAAFGRGDIAAILAGLAPDVRWEMVGRPTDYARFGVRHGVDGAHQFFRMLAENENFTMFEPTEFNSDGDKVFVQGRLALEFKKSGAPVRTDWLHIFTIRGGKVIAFKEFVDTAQFAAASKS